MRSKCPPPACTHDLWWSCQHWWCSGQSQNKFAPSVFAGRRCHKSLFHTRICCMTPQVHHIVRHVKKTLLFNKFFRLSIQDLDAKYSRTKLCNSAQMAIFWRFLRPVFSAIRVQHTSPLHSKFALRPHHVWKYGRHRTSLRPLRISEEKRMIQTTAAKYNDRICCAGRPLPVTITHSHWWKMAHSEVWACTSSTTATTTSPPPLSWCHVTSNDDPGLTTPSPVCTSALLKALSTVHIALAGLLSILLVKTNFRNLVF